MGLQTPNVDSSIQKESSPVKVNLKTISILKLLHMQQMDYVRNTKKMYQTNLHKNGLKEGPRLDGKMMWKIT